tara:strand:+ start:13106 stop:13537 length:432 start_codon:yes stop_codon:yes gene_type:complete
MAKGNWSHIQKMKGHKSGLETRIDEQLKSQNIDGEYEKHEFGYTIPATNHTYKPDFRLPNGIFIESKGWFLPDDRKKHLLIKEQNPDVDLRFVLQSPNGKIYKGSKTTYAQWCEKHGFIWAKKEIPQDWIDEKPSGNFFDYSK